MSKASFPETGKIQNDFFKSLVFPYCGAKREEVITGPQFGVDVAVVSLPNGMGMAITSDPLSLIPTLGLRESAWLSVQLMANDIATTGFSPMYAQFVLNLPPTLSAEDFESYWRYIHEFCERLGTSITGGHTGRFEGQNSTVAGGGTMITFAPVEDIITSKGASAGDVILVTKECALVSTSILALSFPETVKKLCGKDVYDHACEFFYQTSAVEAGLTAGLFGRKTKSITAMHDVTEGGVIGAVFELAHASGCGVRIDHDAIPVGESQQRVGDCFGIDPRYCIGAGSMIITVKQEKADLLIGHLGNHQIRATAIGQMMKPEDGLLLEQNGQLQPLQHPGVDPYWSAFFGALQKGWK